MEKLSRRFLKDRLGEGLPDESLSGYLNRQFEQGRSALEVIDKLRLLSKPVLIDFNNVLVNNKKPLVVNPEASVFMDTVNLIGDPVVVTTATDWKGISETLRQFGLWSEKMILMSGNVWELMASPEDDPGVEGLIRDYFRDTSRELVDRYLHNSPLAQKRIAPLFGKKFDIPLIDDAHIATVNNPGILGLRVRYFEPGEAPISAEVLTILQAAEQAKQYYKDVSA